MKITLSKLMLGAAAISMGLFASCKDEEKTPETIQVEESNTTNTQAQKMNPAHGQPGHRCDLPVGAPLPESGSESMMQQNQQTPSMSTSPIRVNQNSTNSGTAQKNPPHGEPGHRCDLPVGADLPTG